MTDPTPDRDALARAEAAALADDDFVAETPGRAVFVIVNSAFGAGEHTPWHPAYERDADVWETAGRAALRSASPPASGSPQHQTEAEIIDEQADRIAELEAALQWYVENDDTNTGVDGNEFWEAGYRRAAALLTRSATDG